MINKLGDKAVEIYLQALNQGKQTIPYCSMLILGREEVGKTSLFRQLVGKPYLKDMERTQGIDNRTIGTFERRNVNTAEEQWTVKGDGDQSEQFGNALVGEFMGRLPERKSKQTKHVSKSDLLSQLQEFSMERTSQPHLAQAQLIQTFECKSPHKPEIKSPKHSSHSKSLLQDQATPLPSAKTIGGTGLPLRKPSARHIAIETSTPSQQPNDIPAILNPREGSKLNETVMCAQSYVRKEPEPCLNVKDFAGQVVYRPMHHCYINRQAIYVVVFKLPDMLGFIHDRSHSKYNPLDDICYWIRSIHAHTYDNKAEQSRKVLLVGTNRNMLPDVTNSIKEIDTFILENIICIEDKPYVDHIYRIPDSPSACRYFIPVENSIDIVSNPESYLQESGTKYVQGTVKEIAKSLPQFNEQYPIKWLKFEEYLQEQCEACKSTPVMKIEEAKELAVKSGITDEQQQELALQFFNDTGKLIWLSKYVNNNCDCFCLYNLIAEFLPRLFLKDDHLKELRNLIILDPQWLMTMMKDIVELKTDHGNKELLLSNTQAQYLRDGFADFSIFKIFWEETSDSLSAITVQHLCLIFQAYCLIYPVHSVNARGRTAEQKYIIPCKLPEQINDDSVCKSIENHSTFCFDFYEFLPDEIYHRLICLASEMCVIKRKQRVHNRYSKRKCFFFNLLDTNWVVEFHESNQQLIISVL